MRSVLKSREEWFDTLPEPTRTMAINNTNSRKLREKNISMLEAIDAGFSWVETAEGHQFWEEVYLKYRYGDEEE